MKKAEIKERLPLFGHAKCYYLQSFSILY